MIEELEALLDLRNDVLRDELAAGVEFELAEMREELRRRACEELGEREGRALGAGAEMEFDGARGAVEAGTVALGAGRTGVGKIVGGIDAELAKARGGIVRFVVIGGF